MEAMSFLDDGFGTGIFGGFGEVASKRFDNESRGESSDSGEFLASNGNLNNVGVGVSVAEGTDDAPFLLSDQTNFQSPFFGALPQPEHSRHLDVLTASLGMLSEVTSLPLGDEVRFIPTPDVDSPSPIHHHMPPAQVQPLQLPCQIGQPVSTVPARPAKGKQKVGRKRQADKDDASTPLAAGSAIGASVMANASAATGTAPSADTPATAKRRKAVPTGRGRKPKINLREVVDVEAGAEATALGTATGKGMGTCTGTGAGECQTQKAGGTAAEPTSEQGQPLAAPEEEKLYCFCRKPSHHKMIGCDLCDEWYHYKCVGISDKQAKHMDQYFCPKCKDKAKAAEPAAPATAGGEEAGTSCSGNGTTATGRPLRAVVAKRQEEKELKEQQQREKERREREREQERRLREREREAQREAQRQLRAADPASASASNAAGKPPKKPRTKKKTALLAAAAAAASTSASATSNGAAPPESGSAQPGLAGGECAGSPASSPAWSLGSSSSCSSPALAVPEPDVLGGLCTRCHCMHSLASLDRCDSEDCVHLLCPRCRTQWVAQCGCGLWICSHDSPMHALVCSMGKELEWPLQE